jgi:hypothetical protein
MFEFDCPLDGVEGADELFAGVEGVDSAGL